MKHSFTFICFLGLLLASFTSAATVHLGPYETIPATSNASGVVNQTVSYTIDLSDVTGLVAGAPIQIDFTPDERLIWVGAFTAQTGELTLTSRAEMEITVGGFSTTFQEIESFGPVPFENEDPVGGYSFFQLGPNPVTRSLIVPWGTDLSAVTFVLRDTSSIQSSAAGASLTSQVLGPGATFRTTSQAAPEISLERAGGAVLVDNDAVDFGVTVPGLPKSLTFTVRNVGTAPLELSGAVFSGANGVEFRTNAELTGTVAAGGSLDFTIDFTPAAAGLRTGLFALSSNDGDEGLFRLALSGNALSSTADTDADGLNDAAEFTLRDLGFDWETEQSALVATLFNNANIAGLFTAAQVQTMSAGAPLISRDPATGWFKLTMDWKKSTNLSGFVDFPAPAGSRVSINEQGNVEFEFPSTDNAAFYRLELE